jgi:hypothetical protein
MSKPKVRMRFICEHLIHKAAGHDNTDVMIWLTRTKFKKTLRKKIDIREV